MTDKTYPMETTDSHHLSEYLKGWTGVIVICLSLAFPGCGSPSEEAIPMKENATVNTESDEPHRTAELNTEQDELQTEVTGTQRPTNPTKDSNPTSSAEPSAADVPYKNRQWIDIGKIYRTNDSDEPFAYVVLDDRAGQETKRGNFVMAEADAVVDTLPADLFAEIKERCLHAEQLMLAPQSKSDIKDAFFEFNEVLGMLPEPAKKWNVSGWVLSRLGELYFRLEAYEESLPVFDDLMWCPGTIGNPWLHLRKGQVLYEVDEKEAAVQELMRAYMGADKEIFELEAPKYFEFLRSQVDGI